MYYNGYVLTLWGYLAGLLYRTHPKEVFSSACISNSPNLAFLLLRFIECSTFIRDSTYSGSWRHVPATTIIENLSNIIEASVSTEMKARAMAFRLLVKYIWEKGGVTDRWDQPVDEQGKEWTLSESSKAVKMMEDISGKSCVLVYLARIQVEYGTIGIKVPTWDKLMAQSEHFVDREDLYTTCWFLVLMTGHALSFNDNEALKKIIPAIHEVKSLALGEWDAAFRRQLGHYEEWELYKEIERSIYPQSPTRKEVSHHPVGRGPSLSQTLAQTAAMAVVNDVVQDSVNAIFNAP